MKLLVEIALEVSDYKNSAFTWLNNASKWLFVLEEGKRMRTISIEQDAGKEPQSINFAEGKTCTSFSWNRDGSLLALIVEQRQVYFWDIKTSKSTLLKPQSRPPTQIPGSKRIKNNNFELLTWSKQSNKLVICYSSGQLLICHCDTDPLTEKFIDSSEGVLSRVTYIESSQYDELFVCVTKSSEILVMTFMGQVNLYVQGNILAPCRMATLSPMSADYSYPSRSPSKAQTASYWLTLHLIDGSLCLRRVNSDGTSLKDHSGELYLTYDEDSGHEIVDMHWLDASRLIVCLSSGAIKLLSPKTKLADGHKCSLSSEEILNIRESSANTMTDADQKEETFSSFVLAPHRIVDSSEGRGGFSLAALTNQRLFYYDLLELHDCQGHSFEKVDHLDLGVSLSRVQLGLARARWSVDCSMLALQLTNGHILVYRTRLASYMVASYRSKIAYLSDLSEVVVLDYGLKGEEQESSKLPDNDALTIEVGLRPSVLAIGSNHIAVALNNRVRYYWLLSKNDKSPYDEQEYLSVVVGISLCSRFAAVQFSDKRIKLHPVKASSTAGQFDDEYAGERYFPDPSKPESINSFSLTEKFLVFSTEQLTLNVFCLDSWNLIRVCNHSNTLERPILRLKPNTRGTKFVCLAKECSPKQDNICLYNCCSNTVVSFASRASLYQRIFASQLALQLPTLERIPPVTGEPVEQPSLLNRIIDAVWDADERSLLLIERRRIHNFALLEHTLQSEQTLVEYVGSIAKASSYTMLYASQGIASFQTNLGRVINTIMDTHDDEAKLFALERSIQQTVGDVKADELQLQAQVMSYKLDFIRTMLPIHSLSRCKEICEHLMGDQRLNPTFSGRTSKEVNLAIWRQLAARAIFTWNLKFALMIYRKSGLLLHAHCLAEVVRDIRMDGIDSSSSVATRLLLLLGCDVD